MIGIFFYSILIFILLSIFVPSIYNYAYSCFIGRIVLVLLIVYFSKHSILLGLLFVAIIIITSMPLYEGFTSNIFFPKDVLAKNLLVTSNTSIKDITNDQEVFNYFTNYYCAKGSNGSVATPLAPNKDKTKRWDGILNQKKPPADNDSINLALSNKILQQVICNPDISQYYQNFGTNAIPGSGSQGTGPVTGCSTKFIDKSIYCGYWAAVGECPRNPNYMLYNCQESCNRVSGSAATEANYVFNVPQCLPDNFKKEFCEQASLEKLLSSAKNISDNADLDPYLQQDGQWMSNMYSQICKK